MNVVLQSPPLPFSSQPWPLLVSITAPSVIRTHTLSGDLLPGSASASWSLLLEDVKGNFQLTFFLDLLATFGTESQFPLTAVLLAPRPWGPQAQTPDTPLSPVRGQAHGKICTSFQFTTKACSFLAFPPFLSNPPTSLSLPAFDLPRKLDGSPHLPLRFLQTSFSSSKQTLSSLRTPGVFPV